MWAAEKAIGKAKSEWKEATSLMNDLKIKNKLQSLRAWLWASGTVSMLTGYLTMPITLSKIYIFKLPG